jgi:beta-mannosidase
MGSLFWQLNDCWPSVSWSCVDYYFKPKALYYQAKRSFNNLLLSATKSDSILSIVANSDLMSDTTFELKFQLLDFKGTKRWNMNKVVTIKAHTANVVAQLNLLKEITVDTTCNLLNMQLLQNGKLVSESNHFFAFPKDLKLERPNPTIVVRKISSKLYEITIKSKVLLKEVSLTPSIQGQLSDNFFDLLPNCEKKIQFQTNETGELKISFWSLK